MSRKYLYIGHIIYGRNNIYEESLVKYFKKKVKFFDIISLNKSKILYDETITNDGKIKVLHAIRRPLVDEVIRFIELFFVGLRWCLKHRDDDKIIIMLSPSIEVSLAVKMINVLFNIKTVNLIIDTALGNILPDGLIGKYIYKCYQKTEEAYKSMSANIALNKNVFEYLSLYDKPCLHTKIGHDLQVSDFKYKEMKNSPKIIVYTGTLIYYDGIKELLQAMEMLNPQEYTLHIYGKGPDEELVRQYQQEHSNIILKGYLPNREMSKIMKDADLLINPRIDNKFTDIFGFPSKMIEYLLSGTPVLTTKFAAMPEEYKDFVYVIENQTGEGIAKAVKSVLEKSEGEIREKCEKAYEFIYNNNKYSDIVDEMIEFIEGDE